MESIIKGRVVACDTESTGLHTWAGDRPFMFSFASEAAKRPVVEEFPVDPFTRRVNYAARPLLVARLRRFYADPTIKKVFHNSKHDVRHIEAAGIDVSRKAGGIGDTELKLRVCDSTRETYELKPVCRDLFDIGTGDQKELKKAVAGLRTRAKKLGWAVATKATHGKGVVSADFWLIQHAERILVESHVTLAAWKQGNKATRRKMEREARDKAEAITGLAATYAALDAERALILDSFLEPFLAEYKIRHIYKEEMNRIWPVTFAIESRGVYLDRAVAKKGRERTIELEAKAAKKIEKLCLKSGVKGLNPKTFSNSFQQKTKYFIDKLELEPLHYSKKSGNPKLDKSFLEHYAETVPMCGAVQEKNKAKKARTTYFDSLLKESDEAGIWHGSFQQIGAKTGRFSARLLHQVPKRGKCRKCFKDLKIAGWDGAFAICKNCGKATTLDILLEVRRPFGPRPGCVWFGMDFQQIEARIFADEARERFMLKAFRNGEDVYQKFADVIVEITGLPISRQDTKAIFLGKLYGLGRAKLIKSITDAAAGKAITARKAKRVIEVFDDRFPRVLEFMRETIETAKENRAVYNRYGQRIDIKPPYFDPSTGKTFDESYRGVNYIIQSSAARLMKRAMVRCHEYLQDLGTGWIVMTIHDELIFEFERGNYSRRNVKDLAALMADNEGMFKRVKTSVDVSKVTGSWLEPQSVDWVQLAV